MLINRPWLPVRRKIEFPAYSVFSQNGDGCQHGSAESEMQALKGIGNNQYLPNHSCFQGNQKIILR